MQTIKKHAGESHLSFPEVRLVRTNAVCWFGIAFDIGTAPYRLFRWLAGAAGLSRGLSLLGLTVLLAFCGCMPAGPRAFLKGQKLLERGDYAQAAREFEAAAQLLPTNALAFEYLGLALQHSQKGPEAERAYQRALALDHDLPEVHYNLGCLWLSEDRKLDQAKSALTTYTLQRPNAAEGWRKLAEVQMHLRELTAAEQSLENALRLEPRDPEGLTLLGVVRSQRRRPNEAAQLFARALKEQPGYGPALLNSAITAQELNDPRAALQKYREYLALKPVPENAQSVNLLARELELQLNPPRHEPVTNPVPQAAVASARQSEPEPPRATSPQRAPPPASPTPAPTRAESTGAPKNMVATNPPKQAPASQPAAEHFEVAKVDAEPVIKPADDSLERPSTPAAKLPEPPREAPAPASNTQPAKPQRRSLFQRLNPVHLFTHESGPLEQPKPPDHQVVTVKPETMTNEPLRAEVLRKFPRYTYRHPDKPTGGDRTSAQKAFSEGVQQQQARRFADAIQSYRRATQLDPAYYDAYYNLGVAAAENGDLPLALSAYETALSVEPESLDARYNFGLELKRAGYILDAASEFEKILTRYPNDSRAHLALANLYAQQFQDPAKARPHYLAVLAIAPQSPQAGAIRYWLSDHPR